MKVKINEAENGVVIALEGEMMQLLRFCCA
jgi:hypothetical protein